VTVFSLRLVQTLSNCDVVNRTYFIQDHPIGFHFNCLLLDPPALFPSDLKQCDRSSHSTHLRHTSCVCLITLFAPVACLQVVPGYVPSACTCFGCGIRSLQYFFTPCVQSEMEFSLRPEFDYLVGRDVSPYQSCVQSGELWGGVYPVDIGPWP
jgi:hypothetical protein